MPENINKPSISASECLRPSTTCWKIKKKKHTHKKEDSDTETGDEMTN